MEDRKLLEAVKVAASMFGRCCDLYQDGFGTFHCHKCGQATFAMLSEVQKLLGLNERVTEEDAYKRAVLRNAAPDLLEALEDVAKAYQDNFDIMPVFWQTFDNIVTEAISKAKGE